MRGRNPALQYQIGTFLGDLREAEEGILEDKLFKHPCVIGEVIPRYALN